MNDVDLNRLVSRTDEYSLYVAESGCDQQLPPPDDGRLLLQMVEQGEWTHPAARLLLHLARQYGAFILGNAYALAKALKMEDGALGL